MSLVTVVIRPAKRTEIRNLPYEGKGAVYSILGEMFNASRKGQVEYNRGVWSVSRPHTIAVIFGLAERYGRVKVIQHGGVDKCVEQCWTAAIPRMHGYVRFPGEESQRRLQPHRSREFC
jgi:hypothetical protein